MQDIIKRLAVWASIAMLVLMIPFVAMRFTSEVSWDAFDFVIMGITLFGVGLVYELVIKKIEKSIYRTVFSIGLIGAFLLFWINGAVGFFGS